MLSHIRPTAVVLAALLVVLLFPRPALAYVDPGTGGMVLQLLLAGLAGVGVVVRMYWVRLMRLLGLKKADDAQAADANRPRE